MVECDRIAIALSLSSSARDAATIWTQPNAGAVVGSRLMSGSGAEGVLHLESIGEGPGAG